MIVACPDWTNYPHRMSAHHHALIVHHPKAMPDWCAPIMGGGGWEAWPGWAGQTIIAGPVIPELPTWAMMLLGLAFVVGAARRRA